MKKLLVALPVLSGLLVAVACGGDEPQSNPGVTPPGADGGVDAPSGDANPTPRPTLDPSKGSFADARSKVEAIIVQGRDAELQATDRLFPSSDPLALVFARVHYIRTLFQNTGVYTEIGQFAHIRVRHDLKRESSKRFFVIRTANDLFVSVYFEAHNRWNVQRRWKEIENRIEHWLNAFVFESRSAENWEDLHLQCSRTNRTLEFRNC